MMFLAISIGVVVLALVIYLACLDGSFHVRRSLLIDAPVESCFNAIVDLKTWPLWSPWLMHDLDTQLVYSDDYQAEDGYYSWDGKYVGAGKVTHVSFRPGRAIQQQIEFLRPFKSTNQVGWEFEQQASGTLVSWEMTGSMPFLFRFMAKRMEPMIGRDYELGLALLGGYLNDRMPHPKLQIDGAETLQGFSYWAIPCNGNLRQLETARRSSVETLRAAAGNQLGMSLSLFHQFDPEAGSYQAEIAIPVGDNMPAANYRTRSFAGGDYFKLSLRGELKFLPLAWYALSAHCRLHKIKLDAKRPALEIYEDDPGHSVDYSVCTTTLYLPVKS